MAANRVLAVNDLKTVHLIVALLVRCNTLVFNANFVANKFLLRLIVKKKISTVTAYRYRISGTKALYKKISEFVAAAGGTNLAVLVWKGYDLSRAVRKELYWSNFSYGGIYAALQKGDRLVYREKNALDFSFLRASKIFAKYLISLTNKRENKVLSTSVDKVVEKKGHVIFLLKSPTDIALLHEVIVANAENCILVYTKTLASKVKILFSGIVQIEVNERAPMPWHGKLPFKKIRYWEIADAANRLIPDCERYLLALGLANIKDAKVLVMVEGENYAPYAVCTQIARTNGCKSVNVMNGMKAGEAHDSDVDFDYWALWDDEMMEFFERECFLKETTTCNLGHLAYDDFVKRAYCNSIQIQQKNSDHIYVTLFLSGSKSSNDAEFWTSIFSSLNKFVAQFQHVYFLIKEHPTKKFAFQFISELEHQSNFLPVKNNKFENDQIIFDCLSVSKFAITFGSTTALNCIWLGKPCFNFELNENESLLYFSSATVPRIRNVSELEECLHEMIAGQQSQEELPKLQPPVFENYVKFIKELAS